MSASFSFRARLGKGRAAGVATPDPPTILTVAVRWRRWPDLLESILKQV